ncbi:MAG TPA: PaaI family thioesterase [Roseiarcus sp.]|nr:PaaI family thioesterase [Roseiarcus sp.]
MNEQSAAAVQAGRTLPPESIMAMSGLDFIRAIKEGAHPPPPMAELIGFGIAEAEQGRVVFAGTPTERHLNPMGVVHGGYAATLLDSCMTCAVQSALKPGFAATTLDLVIHFTKAATPQSGELRAEGKTVHVGRQFATAEGRLTDGKGRIIAHATTSCLVFSVRPGHAAT